MAEPSPTPPPHTPASIGALEPERRLVLRLVFDPAPAESESVEALLSRLLEFGVAITSRHTPEAFYLVRARVPECLARHAVDLADDAAYWAEIHRDEEVEALRVVFGEVARMCSTGRQVTRTTLGPPAGILDRAERWGVARSRGDAALMQLARAGWLTIEVIAQGVRRVGLMPAGERAAETWLTHPTAQLLLRIGELTWDLGREVSDLPPAAEGPHSTPMRYVERRGTEIWLGEAMLRSYREGAPELELFDRILSLPAPIRQPRDDDLTELGGPILGISSIEAFREYKSRLRQELHQAAGVEILDPRRGMIGLAPGIARRTAPPVPPTS